MKKNISEVEAKRKNFRLLQYKIILLAIPVYSQTYYRGISIYILNKI